MSKFGLIGKHIDYSFSRAHFTKKFETENLDHTYQNFDIDSIEVFPKIIESTNNLKGLNVTIPYKETIIPYLDKLNKKAKSIGAVNTIKVTKKGKLVGYNTDCYGFKKTIEPYIKEHHKKALILGTGGASKAVAYTLKQLGITYNYVSRSATNISKYTYSDLSEEIIREHQIIINCTPLGTHPNVSICPDIPYEGISSLHLLYDLIYNPSETKFLSLGKQQGASICNGQDMLKLQAKKAWEIWN